MNKDGKWLGDILKEPLPTAGQPLAKRGDSAPLRTIELLGVHHATGATRVRVGEEVFSGQTANEAVGAATMALLTQHGRVTLEFY